MADIQRDEYGEPIRDENGNTIPMGEAPAMPGSVVAPAAVVAPPSPRNRIYMGPMTGDPNASPEEFFGNAPSGTRIMPPAPAALSPEDQVALQNRMTTGTSGESDASILNRVQAADRPGTRTIGVSRPPMPDPSEEIFALSQKTGVPISQTIQAVKAAQLLTAQRGWEQDRKAGMSDEDLARKWGYLLGGSLRPMTEYQRLEDDYRRKRLAFEQQRLTVPKLSEVIAASREARADAAAKQKLSPADQQKVDSMNRDMDVMRKALASPNVKDDQINRFTTDLGIVQSRIAETYRKAAAAAAPQNRVAPPGSTTATSPIPAPAASRPSPFKEGALIRDKVTGKRFKVVNGKPVPL